MQHASLLTSAASGKSLTPHEALEALGDGGDALALDEAVGALELRGASSLWFKKEAFLAERCVRLPERAAAPSLRPSFEPEEYVKDLQRYVPLDSLRDALDGHLSSLKTEVRSAGRARHAPLTRPCRSCWS